MLKRVIWGMCGLGLVAGCIPFATVEKARNTELPEVSCFTRPQGGCVFDQNPLRVESKPVTIPNRPYQFFPTAVTLNFTDALGKSWQAPRGTLTDGASIPEIFVSIVGDPTSPEFINAAAVHDAYCGVGNEAGPRWHDGRWEDVHRMFYDGLIVGGTPELRAKLMYAAVWLGGPRWETSRRLDQVPTADLQRAMSSTKTFIARRQPTLPELERFLRKWERHLLINFTDLEDPEMRAEGERMSGYPSEPGDPYLPGFPFGPNDPYDPYDPGYPGDPTSPGDGLLGGGGVTDPSIGDGGTTDLGLGGSGVTSPASGDGSASCALAGCGT